MKRRAFIAALGGAAVLPVALRAQLSASPVIGFLNSASPEPYALRVGALFVRVSPRRAMSKAGTLSSSIVGRTTATSAYPPWHLIWSAEMLR
jgi:hypothetical protein